MAGFNGKEVMLVGLKGEKGEQGATGAKIVSTVLKGQDENGGNIYQQTFDDGSTATFVAPRGSLENIVHTTGDSETAVMCQKTVTDELRYLEMNDVKRKPSYFLWGTNKYSPESSWVDIEGVNVYKLRGVRPFDVIEVFTTDEALELPGWRSQYMCVSESETGALTKIMPAIHDRQKSVIIQTPYNCVNLYWICLPTANFNYRFVLDYDSEVITRKNVYTYSVNEYLADMGCYFGNNGGTNYDSTITSATFYLNKGDTVSIKSINTEGMSYNIVARKKTSEGWATFTYALVTSEWVAPDDCVVNLMQSLVADSSGTVKEFDVDVIPYAMVESNDLSAMKWVAFGDSITARNTWQPYIINKYGLAYANLGIGSTCIINAGNSPMCGDDRINAIIAENPDIVTILGGANDITFFEGGSNATAPYPTMGDKAQFELALEDKDKTTFYGAYSYIVEKLLTWKPTLRIIVLGTTYGDLDGKKYNPTGQYTNKDFAKASEEVAYNYGLTFVDLYGNVGFNKFTMNASPNDIYSSDFIHPNEAGSLRIAEVVNKTFSTLFNY